MNKFIYSLAAAMVICLAVTAYSKGISEDLQVGVVRLHIIANSDSADDQAVKLKVRDAVLKSVKNASSSADLAAIKNTADAVLKENGFGYSADAETGLFYFPEKSYKDTTFPAGAYRAVRIILGDGGGQNWWCVMYPPLCFEEDPNGTLSADAREQLQTALDDETYKLITEKPVIKFKIVELVNEMIENNR